MDRLVDNDFDHNHNTYMTIRRHGDIYEWGNNVLWPGLFADAGPCNQAVGLVNTYLVKGCNDDAWHDGENGYSQTGARPLDISELLERMDQFDWTEGVLIKQVRTGHDVSARAHQAGHDPRGRDCSGSTGTFSGCLPDVDGMVDGSRTQFGYNWTTPSSALDHPCARLSTLLARCRHSNTRTPSRPRSPRVSAQHCGPQGATPSHA